MKTKTISVVIPFFNEEEDIVACLDSLSKQTLTPIDIILVDDGSSDNSELRIKNLEAGIKNLSLLKQDHKGPGVARNLGAKHAKGEILVFIDSDMTYKEDFLEKLVSPIVSGETKGTFTKEEYVSNWDNVLARCWNYNNDLPDKRKIPLDYPDTCPVFRAILKSEFEKVNGFDDIGFTDDWSLSRKLGFQSVAAPAAICYHRNPSSLLEIFAQARWIGKNEFLTKTIFRKVFNLLKYSCVCSIIRGVAQTIRYHEPTILIFRFAYDGGIFISVLLSFFGEKKYK